VSDVADGNTLWLGKTLNSLDRAIVARIIPDEDVQGAVVLFEATLERLPQEVRSATSWNTNCYQAVHDRKPRRVNKGWKQNTTAESTASAGLLTTAV
jgi:hypothetical protein